MNNRITSQWTKTTAEAFGDTREVRKGLLAEQMYLEYAKKVYDDVKYYEEDQALQVAGIDFTIHKNSWFRPYGVDVKGNLTSKGGFFIENNSNGWLRNPKKKNDRVVHICTETGWAVEYDRKAMIKLLDELQVSVDLLPASVYSKELESVLRRFKVK